MGVKLDEELVPIPIGTWEEVRPGKDAAILAIGPMVGSQKKQRAGCKRNA